MVANEKFENAVFSDECTVQLDHHGRVCFRRKKEPRKLKPWAKHPVKVHIWGAISHRGAAQLVIFMGVMTAIHYCSILESSLLPFLQEVYPKGHRFQKDNDRKHCSKYTQQFFADRGVNWWKTPPESPDLNAIENIWASLKHYLRHDYKPRNLDSLVSGILKYWESLTHLPASIILIVYINACSCSS